MKTEAQLSRNFGLHLARRFGRLFIRGPHSVQTRINFLRVFPYDRQAQEQFDLGIVEEDQKRLALGLTLDEYRAACKK
ncbi:hypothetical protein JH25_27880 [Pseudomonas sp. BRG-100]|uniref:hypothetical protein n=1 Tax=Pseudomonas sp. BRG-100 TaxID=1524267 RepID=UPI0004E640CA|nr:hypothetical protein [Pseudomonas sp. BRG-100]KFF42189.1 hypothetical protein JH25_27880 [Pseudomonas sp. BRG-100]